ncbi:MAG: NAD-dependent epimerase/dehydratase family protein [Acidimicrobiia bacterium]
MHYLLTDASGFLGAYIAGYLLSGGHQVTTLVRSREEGVEMVAAGVRPFLGSVVDKEGLRPAVRGVDGVFHVAGHRVAIGDRRLAEAVHVQGTRNVFELVKELRVPRVVHTSTLSVFSDTHGELPDESYRFTGKHLTRYDALRWRAHYEVAAPMMAAGLPGVIIMPGATYGAGDASGMAGLLARYLRGRVRFVSDTTAYCWAHVEDVAQAHVLAMEFGRIGETYIVGGQPHSVRSVLAAAGELAGKAYPPLPLPRWAVHPPAVVLGGLATVLRSLRPTVERLRVSAGVTYLGTDAKARAELGFDPRTLEEGLPETVEWILRDSFERV